jgi:hypothetical protein
MKKVYVAHPYGGKEENKIYVENIILKLTAKYPNTLFISPIHALGYLYPVLEYNDGMRYCYALLEGCDELLLCEGWGDSTGCNLENTVAIHHNIPIKYCVYIGDDEYVICPVSLNVPCTLCYHHKNNRCTVMDDSNA